MSGESAVSCGCGTAPGQLLKFTIEEQVQAEIRGGRTRTKAQDIAATGTDLESPKVRLDRAIGDLTGQSSLIARTREELEELRHRGDRNYYEFSLYKGKHPTQLSTVALQLKKADPKRNKFTLSVIADDRVIEKKDRGAAEPLQFLHWTQPAAL